MKGGKYNAIQLHRLSKWLLNKKLNFASKIVDGILFQLFNSVIPSSCSIGKGTFCSHRGIAVVLHPTTIIGCDVTIGTSVVCGGLNGHDNPSGGPIIGDNVYLGTGSKILGPIKIGNGAKIGANSVVLQDIPENATVVGVPGRVVKINE